MAKKAKTGGGGARAGAGRPAGKPTVHRGVRLPEEVFARYEKRAAREGCAVHKIMVDVLIKHS